MKKIFIFVIIMMFVSVMSGCDLTGSEEYLMDGTIVNNNLGDKEQPEIAIAYKIRKKSSISQEIEIKIYLGTSIRKGSFGEVEKSEAEIFVIDTGVFKSYEEERKFCYSPDEYPHITRSTLKKIDDFCMENYPMPINGNYSFSFNCLIDENVFKSESGKIVICLLFYDLLYCFYIQYEKDFDMMYFKKVN